MSSDLDDRYKALDKALIKKFGEEYFGFDIENKLEPIKFISTGCTSIDMMLNGGLPEGRIIEVFGGFSSGKTALALFLISSFQKMEKNCFLMDLECTFDKTFASYCGVNVGRLGMAQPFGAGKSMDMARELISSGLIDLLVIDSIAALTPEDEIEKELGGGMIGSTSRLLSKALKQFAALANKNKCTVLCLNQIRSCNFTGYGPKSSSTGGNALPFYASVRIQSSKSGNIEHKGEKVGITTTLQTVKNKTYTPFKVCELSIYFPYMVNGVMVAGVDRISDIMSNAITLDIIEKKGSWFKFGEYINVQGMMSLREYLLDDRNKNVLEEIDGIVRSKLSCGKSLYEYREEE